MDLRPISLALAAAALSACGSPEVPDFSTTLKVEAAEDGAFAEGEPITFTVTTTNHTDRTLQLYWCAGQTVQVFDSDGNLAWSLDEGTGGQAGCGGDTYAPREQRSWQWAWHQDYNDGEPNYEFDYGRGSWTPVIGEVRVPPGAYHAAVIGLAFEGEGALTGTNSRPVDFLVR